MWFIEEKDKEWLRQWSQVNNYKKVIVKKIKIESDL